MHRIKYTLASLAVLCLLALPAAAQSLATCQIDTITLPAQCTLLTNAQVGSVGQTILAPVTVSTALPVSGCTTSPGVQIYINGTEAAGVTLSNGASSWLGTAGLPYQVYQWTESNPPLQAALDPAGVGCNNFLPITIAVHYQALATTLETLPSSLSFGNQVVGTASAVQLVTLLNPGQQVSLTDFGVSDGTDFTLSTPAPGTPPSGGNPNGGEQCATNGEVIPPLSWCQLGIVFNPQSAGPFTATLEVLDTASNSPQTVTITGTGIAAAPQATVTPSAIAFGTEGVGATSAPQTLTLTNTGTATLSISVSGGSGYDQTHFPPVSWTCAAGLQLPPNQSCTFTLGFHPTALESYSDSFLFTTNDPVNPTITVPLSGTGVNDWTEVEAHQIIDAGGNPLASGTLCLVGTSPPPFNTVLNFRAGSGGQVITRPICKIVTNGAIPDGSLYVPDSSLTSPTNVVYQIIATANTSAKPVLEYQGVYITGPVFLLDNYLPQPSSFALGYFGIASLQLLNNGVPFGLPIVGVGSLNLAPGCTWSGTSPNFTETCTGSGVTSFNGRTGAVTPESGDYGVGQVTGAAPLASPALTGTPTAPTQTTGDSSNKLATDAFVANAVASAGSGANPALSNLAGVAINTALLPGSTIIDLGSSANPFRNLYISGAISTGAGVTACLAGVTGCWAAAEGATAGTPTAGQDYWRWDSTAHGPKLSLNGGAEFNLFPLPVSLGGSGTASPSLVNGSGISITGSWPNQTVSYTGSGGGVTSWNSRTGAVTPQSGDYAVGQVTGAAPLASPAFTGAPTVPTQSTSDTSTDAASDAFVHNVVNATSGVTSVGLALPSQFTVTGSPVTGSGTLTGAWAAQVPGYIFGVQAGTVALPLFNQSTTCNATGLGNTTTCSFTGTVMAGDGVILMPNPSGTTFTLSGAVTDNYGDTCHYDSGHVAFLWSCDNMHGGTTTFTFTGDLSGTIGKISVLMIDFNNMSATGAILDQVGTEFAGNCPSTGVLTMPAITTALSNPLLVGFVADNSSVAHSWVAGAGFTLGAASYYAPLGEAVAMEYAAPASAGTYGATAGCYPGDTVYGVLLSYRGTSAAPAATPDFYPDGWTFVEQAFPGLNAYTPASLNGATGIELQTSSYPGINSTNATSAYAGNNAASTLFTAPGTGPVALHCWLYVSCHTAVSTATVLPALLWTDESGTAETMNGTTATCTTLGTSDVSSQAWPIRLAAGSTAYLKTTLANSPHYDVHASCLLANTQ